MGLAIRFNPDTGEDEFYDDGESSGLTSGASYRGGDSDFTWSSAEGSAGESAARDYIMASKEYVPEAESVFSLWSGNDSYETGSRAAAGRLSETNLTGLVGDEDKGEMSFFDKLKGGIAKAYDKDPMKALELGFGTLAGLYKTSEARKLQQSQAQAALDQLAAKAQIERDNQDRYTASLSGGGPRSNTKKPLTRQNGSRVYNLNGTLNRG